MRFHLFLAALYKNTFWTTEALATEPKRKTLTLLRETLRYRKTEAEAIAIAISKEESGD